MCADLLSANKLLELILPTSSSFHVRQQVFRFIEKVRANGSALRAPNQVHSLRFQIINDPTDKAVAFAFGTRRFPQPFFTELSAFRLGSAQNLPSGRRYRHWCVLRHCAPWY